MLFIEMLQRAITDLFCFGAKSRVFVCFKAYSQTKLTASTSCHSLHFQRKRELTKSSVQVHFFNKVKMKFKKMKVGSGRIRTHNLRI